MGASCSQLQCCSLSESELKISHEAILGLKPFTPQEVLEDPNNPKAVQGSLTKVVEIEGKLQKCSSQGSTSTGACSQEDSIPDVCSHEALIATVSESVSSCNLREANLKLKRISVEERSSLPEQFVDIPLWVDKIDALRKACNSREGPGWKHFDLDICQLWRLWDTHSGNLRLILSFEARGSLEQQISSMRNVDVIEPLWDGACIQTVCQHSQCRSLVRWLQKDPLSGKKMEVILQRVFCDCLDDISPCWVVLEQTPDLPDFDHFTGAWGPFHISELPKGHFRTVTAPGGRIIEPIARDRCRVTMELSVHIPAVIAWMVTDSLLAWAIKLSAKSATSSWDRIIDGWDSCDFSVSKGAAAFQTQLESRLTEYFSRLA